MCTFKVAVHISLTLFHCLGQFNSRLFWGHNLGFQRVGIFYSAKLLACHPIPNLQGQNTIFISHRAGWPSFTPGTGYPFWLPFTSCMGCSGIIIFPGHHTGNKGYQKTIMHWMSVSIFRIFSSLQYIVNLILICAAISKHIFKDFTFYLYIIILFCYL